MNQRSNTLVNTQIEEVLEVVKNREIDQVFFIACGGSSALMYSSKYLIDHESSKIKADVFNSNEFIYRNPASLGETTLAILCSHLGKTPETTEAAMFARKKGALTIALTYDHESPLAKESDYVIGYEYGPEIDPAKSRNIIIYQLVMGILNVKEGNTKYAALKQSLPHLQNVVDKAVVQYAQRAIEFANEYKDEKFIYTMASGSNFGVAYTFAICILMEMQWINSHAIHAGEFFHGPFEILDKETPFIMLLGLDETRPMEERALEFLERYGEKQIVLDAKTLDLCGVKDEVKGYVASVVLLYILRSYSRQLAEVRNHPLEKRRYMFKVPY